MQISNLRSSYEKVGEIVFFGRMLDKIRLYHQGKLPDLMVDASAFFR